MEGGDGSKRVSDDGIEETEDEAVKPRAVAKFGEIEEIGYEDEDEEASAADRRRWQSKIRML